MPTCNLCHNDIAVTTIYKQIAGEFKRFEVCKKCKEQHDRELEMTRENFKRQFGDR